MTSCRLLVLCSGAGSNLQAIINACESGRIPASVSKVITNRKTAYAATRAKDKNIPHEYVNLVNLGYHAAGEKDAVKLADARSKYDADLAVKVLQEKEKVDMVVLAGWMYVFSPSFLTPLETAGIPVINLHPALPGQYDGANAIARAHADCLAGKLENNRTGVMVHYVIGEVDRGEPILVQEVNCSPTDTLADLEERIHGVEHELLVRAVAQLAESINLKKAS